MSVESVVKWANKLNKGLWWRHVIRLAAQKGALNSDDLALIFEIAKMEYGLEQKDESFDGYTSPLELIGFGDERHAVKLKSISNVNHVSALVSDKLLEFDTEGLTAIYGDNGSGKSSYAKILKNACLTRGDTPKILPNIYANQVGEPSSQIGILINNELQNVDWYLSSAAREDLKSIRIFDNTSANHYISGEDSVEYKPAGMKLLAQLMTVCEFVRAASEKEKKPYTTAAALPHFTVGTSVHAFISKISEKTRVEEVEAFCLSREQECSISTFQNELTQLKAGTPEQIRKLYRDRCRSFQPLSEHLNKLRNFLDQDRLEVLRKAYNNYITKKSAAELARKKVLDGHELSGICSPEWIDMWKHVRAFIQTHNPGIDFPPKDGSLCPTCLQTTTIEAAHRLKLFDAYLLDQTQLEANKAKREFDSHIKSLKSLRFDLNPYDFSLSLIREHNSVYADKIIELNSKLELICANLVKAEPDFDLTPVEFNAAEWVEGQIRSWKMKADQVATNEGLEKQVVELTAIIKDLDDKRALTASKENVLNEINRRKMFSLYNSLIRSCQSSTITSQTSLIAKSGAIGNLKNAFRRELKELGFQNFEVDTETRGSRGRQMLKLRLVNKTNNISDVASEGEQKCIALASFMAELIVDERRSAIMFDDPINSLDHKWRRKFANRIARESLNRQVIVFTHDMSFLKMLEEASDEAHSRLNVISIAKRGNTSGYPNPEPPWDVKNTASRIGVLKNKLPQLKKMEESGDLESYEHHAKQTYNLMRETWERLVEEWLLRKVVERFSRSVKTQSLKEIMDDVTSEDNDLISAAMSKCSTHMYGHDNAPDLAVDCPPYNEVAQDIKGLDMYFKALKKRR